MSRKPVKQSKKKSQDDRHSYHRKPRSPYGNQLPRKRRNPLRMM